VVSWNQIDRANKGQIKRASEMNKFGSRKESWSCFHLSVRHSGPLVIFVHVTVLSFPSLSQEYLPNTAMNMACTKEMAADGSLSNLVQKTPNAGKYRKT
jgi:hypothetical protein